MHDAVQLRERALAAREKKAELGVDIDLSRFKLASDDHKGHSPLDALPMADQRQLEMAGQDLTGENRDGSFLLADASTVHCSTKTPGLTVTPIKEALAHHDWVRDYYMNLIQVDQDKYTASAFLNLHGGYVIHAQPGAKAVHPMQACLYMQGDMVQQNVHNIIIVEEGAELHLINGCTVSPEIESGLHVGITEIYVKKNAKLSFTMINNWSKGMYVRPREAIMVEEGGQYLSNYVCMQPVRSLQGYPTARLAGENAVARMNSVIVGDPDSDIDLGGRTIMDKPDTRAEIISRAITNGGKIMNRGHLVGNVPEVKAHLECRGLILNGGSLLAVPMLDGHAEGVEMSHEAAVGKINQDEILYLMSRGLTEDQATATIVRGFLNVEIPGLPPALKAEIDKALEAADQSGM
ncbi:SufB/SufD family protein [Dethiosulfatarculus sandiegensis]|uniref:SUF system FeS cluster assembly SufBD core domain-containing protein n=1 Tax=Dethiosulfatarculus sandiegensis TaxID=1429043 RepID=A0A0D2JB33_9BACT|nr:SufD family Fe-S cluster assembly protein [Dethiosulfatarculus sandiegensis]KIX15334.1 hypothetical protein X474_04195 [Dethiosulfatarculus sandiegensis]